MIQKYFQAVNRNMESSFSLRAHGLGGASAIFFSCLPLFQSAEGAQRGWEATALFCVSRKAKRKNFRSLIEKILSGAHIKNMLKIFPFCFSAVRRSGAGAGRVPCLAGRQVRPSGRRILLKVGSSIVQ